MPSRRKLRLFEDEDLGDYDIHAASIKDVEAAGSSGEPLRLYTPMTLASGRLGFEIYSPSPMIINGITLWSATPIRVIGTNFPSSFPIHLELSADLNVSFAQGWIKLPDELKEKILSCYLVTNYPVEGRNPIFDLQRRTLLQYLHSTPEIASFSRDIYYRLNTFRLRPTSDLSPVIQPWQPIITQGVLRYPMPSVNRLIRSVHFVCPLKDWATVFLARFAQGNYGFQDLRYVKITFCAGWHIWGAEDQFRDFFTELANLANTFPAGLRLACKGELEVVDELNVSRSFYEVESDDTAEENAEDRRNGARLRKVEAILKRKIHFGCSKSKRGVVADPL